MSYKTVNLIHQGDVLLVREGFTRATFSRDTPPRADKTLKLGETTGHHHTLIGEGVQVLGDMDGVQWVVVTEEEVELQHLPLPGVEHNTVPVPPGVWFVPVQVEDDGEADLRRIAD